MKSFFEAYREIIPDFSLFQESLQKPFPAHLRVNRLRIEPDSLVRLLAKRGVHLERSIQKDESLFLAPGLKSPGNLPEYFAGHIHPQALVSCLAAIALNPKKDAYVLDMCAAPGGKTSHMAQLMENSGIIVANELYSSRHVGLGHTLSRLGVLNTVVTAYQAQEFPMRQGFDFLMADVPCSGEGMFRQTSRNVFYSERKSKGRLPDLQKKIILRGFDQLADDGIMLYSTCTYNPEENESVVNHLLTNRDARLLPLDVGIDYEPGISQWKKDTYDKDITKTARFYPHKLDSVGFFMARIGRRG